MADFENNQIPQAPVAPQAPVTPVAPLSAQAPQAPQQEVNLPQANASNPVDQAKDVAQKVLKNPKLPIIAVAAVAVIVVIVIISAIAGKGYEKAWDNYVDVMAKGESKKIEKLLPQEAWEYLAEELEDEFDSADELIEACEEGCATFYDEEIVDEYGKFKKADIEIDKAKKVSDSRLEKIAEALADEYDIDEDSVKKAYKFQVDGEFVFEDDEWEIDDQELYSVKIKGDWYLVSGDGDYYWLLGIEAAEFCFYE